MKGQLRSHDSTFRCSRPTDWCVGCVCHWCGRGTDGGARAGAQRGWVLRGCGAGVQSREEGLPPPDPDPHQVTGLSVTSGRDQLVVLHARGQDDLVVCLHRSQPPLDNRIGELVGVLAAHCQG